MNPPNCLPIETISKETHLHIYIGKMSIIKQVDYWSEITTANVKLVMVSHSNHKKILRLSISYSQGNEW